MNNNDWPPQDSAKRLTRGEEAMVAAAAVSPGAAVFQTRGCMNCHALQGKGGAAGLALDHAGRKMTMEQIEHYLRDPTSMNPKALMPAQKDLSDKEREDVAKFLARLK